MSAPDYTDEVIDARCAMRERFAPGTRVRRSSAPGDTGTVTKLHVGTVKLQRPIGAWRASVQWDGKAKPTIHALVALRPETLTAPEARDAILAGERVRMTVEPGHVLHVWLDDGMVYSECMQGWCAGALEPVCAHDSDFLLHKYLRGELALLTTERSA